MISDCPFCHHKRFQIYRKNQLMKNGANRDIVICRECGLLYPALRMEEQDIHEYLVKIYTNQAGTSYSDPAATTKNEIRYWDFLKRRIKTGGCALDIGAFNGWFCHILGLLGFRAYGLEPQAEVVKFARGEGFDVYLGSFPDNIPEELRNTKYVLISLMESIYYLQDLKDSMLKIYDMLIDDGYLLIKCHQGRSRYYENNSFFSRYSDYVQGIPTLQSMQFILNNSGFKIIQIMGDCSPELLPSFIRFSAASLLSRIVPKLYNLVLLNWTLLDINKADRLIILARKVKIT